MKKVVPHVNAGGADKEIVCRIFVAPSDDAETVRAAAKFAIATYLNVPVYAEFHRWLGRADVLQPMWDAWKAGDRKQALAEIPDSLVDELVVHGTPAECRADPALLRQRRHHVEPRRHALPGHRPLGSRPRPQPESDLASRFSLFLTPGAADPPRER